MQTLRRTTTKRPWKSNNADMATCQHMVMQNGCADDDPFSFHADVEAVNQQMPADYGHLADCKLGCVILLTLDFNATKHLRSPPVTAAGESIFRSDPKLPGDGGMFAWFLMTLTTPTTHSLGSLVQPIIT